VVGIKKIDGINIGKNLEKGSQKKTVEKNRKKINSTVVGKKWREKTEKSSCPKFALTLPLP
jgi:hypothetical protein